MEISLFHHTSAVIDGAKQKLHVCLMISILLKEKETIVYSLWWLEKQEINTNLSMDNSD